MKPEYNPKDYKFLVIRQFNPYMGDFYWTIEEIEPEARSRKIQNGLYLLPYPDAVKMYGEEDNIDITTDVLGTFAFREDAERFIRENENLYEFQNRYRGKFIKKHKTPYEFV